MKARINDPDLDVTADSVLISAQRRARWVHPGFPNGACCRFHKNYCRRASAIWCGLSDARMSGTSYGTCVLHIAPKVPPAVRWRWCKTATIIEIDVPDRTIHWDVSDEEIEQTPAAMPPLKPFPERGYATLYAKHVSQADKGCDFDFLIGRSPGERTGDFLNETPGIF